MTDNNIYYVYIAIENEVVRYVGFGKERRFEHVNSGATHVRQLNYKVLVENVIFKIEFLMKDISRSKAIELEKYYISQYKLIEEGGTLYNQTRGGIGFSGGHTESVRKRIKQTSLSMWSSLTPEETKIRKENLLSHGKATRFTPRPHILTKPDGTVIAIDNISVWIKENGFKLGCIPAWRKHPTKGKWKGWGLDIV